MPFASDAPAMAVDRLQDLPGVSPATAATLREAGFDSDRAIAYAAPDDIAAVADVGSETARAIVTAARERAGLQSGSTLIAHRAHRPRLTTGVAGIDALLGGGIPRGAITEIHGPAGSGKTQLAQQLAVTAQLPAACGGLGGQALFIDGEDTFRPDRIRDVVRGLDDETVRAALADRGIDGPPTAAPAVAQLVDTILEGMHVAKARSSSHQLLLGEEAEALVAERVDSPRPVQVVCVDSVTGHLRAEYGGEGQLLERQQKLNKHLQDLRRIAAVHDVAVVVTNQVATDPDHPGRDPTTPIGGNILGHACQYRLALGAAEDRGRTVRLVDAPDRPPGETALRIDETGVVDA